MTRPPYNDARRVFWIVDNCSSHRGKAAVERLDSQYPQHPRLQLVHAPTHSSWLNQVEIYFFDLATKGPHAQRLPGSGCSSRAHSRFSVPLGIHRAGLRVEVHTSRS
ncbi:MAG: transposase [Acidobacteriia bacterium]|nr:transposase [Terriglobia bacterium]